MNISVPNFCLIILLILSNVLCLKVHSAYAQTSIVAVDLDGDGLSDGVCVPSPNGEPGKLIKLNSGTSNSSSLSRVCTDLETTGWLYKPESQDTGPPRAGKPLVLFTSNAPSAKSKLKIYASNGRQICTFASFSETRFYSGLGCRATGSQLATLAKKAAGSDSHIYIETVGTTCIGPINPTERTDNR